MTSCVLITEGELDAELMKAVLVDVAPMDVKYIATGGWSGADSLARSYLTDPDTKVGVVVDADTVDSNAAEERKRFLRRSLGQIAESERWRVVVIVPEIEALLFKHTAVIEGLIGRHIDPTELVRGEYEPRATLANLIPGLTVSEMRRRLAAVDLSPIRNQPEIRELKTFFQSKRRKVAV